MWSKSEFHSSVSRGDIIPTETEHQSPSAARGLLDQAIKTQQVVWYGQNFDIRESRLDGV